MKKIILLSLLFSLNSFSQEKIGINVPLPIANLDIDGDVRISKIEDKQSNFDKSKDFLLITDESNFVKKVNVFSFNEQARTPQLASFSTNGYNRGRPLPTSFPLQTDSFIELDPGFWIVQSTLLIKCSSFKSGTAQWVRTSFSDTRKGQPSRDIISGSFVSGAIHGPSEHSTINGAIIVRNNSNVKKRYYLVVISSDFYDSVGVVNNSNDRCTFDKFGSSNWSENNIFATPL